MNRLRSLHFIVIISATIIAAATAPWALRKPQPVAAAHTVTYRQTFQYDCGRDVESMPCLEQHYQIVTQQQGAAVAFMQLKAAYNTDPNIKAYCHQLTHAIGRTEADIVGDVDQAYAQGDNFCWSGYYHGVMESIVLRIGKPKLAAALPTICAKIRAQRSYSFYHYNCVHGLGHGIMAVTSSDLFKSLSMCDLLNDSWEQESCYGGVFMENEMDEVNPDHSTVYLKVDQPMYPCTAVAEKYKEQCYLTQTSHALRVANEDFRTVFNECAAVEAAYVNTCYQSLGRDASGNTSSDIAGTKTNCLYGPTEEARLNCVVGAVKDFVSYYHNDTQANGFCRALDATLQATCQTTKRQYYATL